jgi:hypothetical protein
MVFYNLKVHIEVVTHLQLHLWNHKLFWLHHAQRNQSSPLKIWRNSLTSEHVLINIASQNNNVSRDTAHIPKFDGSNFHKGKFGLMLLLRNHDLQKIFLDIEKLPTEVTNLFQSRFQFYLITEADSFYKFSDCLRFSPSLLRLTEANSIKVTSCWLKIICIDDCVDD